MSSGLISNDPRRRKQKVDQVARDLLNGKTEDQIINNNFGYFNEVLQKDGKLSKNDLNPQQFSEYNGILDESKKKAGIGYQTFEKDTTNSSIQEQKLKELVIEFIKSVEGGADLDDLLDEYYKKISKIKVSDEIKKRYVDDITKYLGLSSMGKEEQNQDISLDDGNKDYIPLPRIEEDYDNLKYLQLKEDDKNLIPGPDQSILSKQIIDMSQEYANAEDEEEKEKISNRIFKTKGRLVLGTERFEDYLRQVKLALIFLPLGISKAKMETALIEFMSRIPERFSFIYVFGWETQVNKTYYKDFDDLLKINEEVEGALFILRDLPTFNVYASEVMRGSPRNYYLIIGDSISTKEELSVIENIANDNVFLWPAFADLNISIKNETDVSFIYGEQNEEYMNVVKRNLNNPLIGQKEVYTNLDDNKALYLNARKLLNVSLTVNGTKIESFAGSGLNLDIAIEKSPKFRNMIIKIISATSQTTGGRILVKLPQGEYGLESFLYIFQNLKRIPIKPVIVRRNQEFLSKKNSIKSIPDQGPCLILTDYVLTDTTIPNNIDKFYICGGGEPHDIETIIDLCKGENYTRDIYPRSLEVVNFISKVEGPLKTVDEYDLEDFSSAIQRFQNNLITLKKLCITTYIREDKLYVRGSDF